MKKFLLIIIAFFLIAAGKAQRGIDGITFMENRQEAMKELINKFGQPVSEVGDKVVFKNVLFNGINILRPMSFSMVIVVCILFV